MDLFLSERKTLISKKINDELNSEYSDQKLVEQYQEMLNIMNIESTRLLGNLTKFKENLINDLIALNRSNKPHRQRRARLIDRFITNHIDIVLTEMNESYLNIYVAEDTASETITSEGLSDYTVTELVLDRLETEISDYRKYFVEKIVGFLEQTNKSVYIGVTTRGEETEHPLFMVFSRGFGKGHHKDKKLKQVPKQIYYSNLIDRDTLLEIETDVVDHINDNFYGSNVLNRFKNIARGGGGVPHKKNLGILYLRIYSSQSDF